VLSALPDGARFISADSERITWRTDAPARVDVIAFEEFARDGNDEAALAEYAGPLLPTIYDEWTTRDRERLQDLCHEVLARTIARERSERRFDAATAHVHRLLEDDPWREDMVRQLMAIRYESGDRAGALAAFDSFARRLRDEMKATPMPETIDLRDPVLRGARLATSEPPRRQPASGAPDIALPLVGRDAALEQARAAWHAAADGRPGVLFIGGEAGCGKSRLTTEFALIAEREGSVIVRGFTSSGEYAAGSTGNVSPIATISGSATGLGHPVGISLDADDNIYVADSGYLSGTPSVEVFAAGSNGNVAPKTTIAGTKTKFQGAIPYDVALDASGNLHVPEENKDTIATFAAGAHGNVKPSSTLKGKKTDLNSPVSLFIR